MGVSKFYQGLSYNLDQITNVGTGEWRESSLSFSPVSCALPPRAVFRTKASLGYIWALRSIRICFDV